MSSETHEKFSNLNVRLSVLEERVESSRDTMSKGFEVVQIQMTEILTQIKEVQKTIRDQEKERVAVAMELEKRITSCETDLASSKRFTRKALAAAGAAFTLVSTLIISIITKKMGG